MLENQGIRHTARGGHLAAYQAVRATRPPWGRSCGPSTGGAASHDADYPPGNTPALTQDDVREDIPKAAAIIDIGQRVLDQMSPF